eukprot:s6101_g7.t1
MVMVKADHIFHGIIYGKPHHPRLRQAIQHAFGRQVFAAKANLEYMIFCKFLWEVLRKDMGQVPTAGWNVSPTYGPIYLFQERYDKKRSKTCDVGGHFVPEDGTVVAYTRCWKWQKGFQGDPTTKERADKMLQSNLAAIRLERKWNGAQLNSAKGTAHSRSHSHKPT